MNNGPAEEYKKSMNDRLRKSKERIDELRAETQAKARRAVRITNNYAHDHPWRMVATGVALAFAAGFLMNTKRPRKVVLKQPKPVIKIKAAKPEKKRSPFSVIHAFMPLILLGAKQALASRQKNQLRSHPVTMPASAPQV